MEEQSEDVIGKLTIERVASLLADRVADKVARALRDAGLDKELAGKRIKASGGEAQRKVGAESS
jgi:hypothetical protein